MTPYNVPDVDRFLGRVGMRRKRGNQILTAGAPHIHSNIFCVHYDPSSTHYIHMLYLVCIMTPYNVPDVDRFLERGGIRRKMGQLRLTAAALSIVCPAVRVGAVALPLVPSSNMYVYVWHPHVYCDVRHDSQLWDVTHTQRLAAAARETCLTFVTQKQRLKAGALFKYVCTFEYVCIFETSTCVLWRATWLIKRD